MDLTSAITVETYLPLLGVEEIKASHESKKRYFRVECIGSMPYPSSDGYVIKQYKVLIRKPLRPVRYMQLRKALAMMEGKRHGV